MKKYQRKNYCIKKYEQEKYSLNIFDNITNTSKTIYKNNYEELYMQAKEEAKNGKECEICELVYEVKP